MNRLLLSFALLLPLQPLSSQWSTDPSENTRVTHGGLLPQIITDGSGGAYIVYQDSPALLRQLWVQRLDRYGFVRFPENGIRVSSEDRSQTPDYFLVSDSVGGVIVAFRDFREIDDGTRSAVYVQRLDSLGRKLWGEAGIEVRDDEVVVSACSDGGQGVFVFWSEGPTSIGFQLRAQRVKAAGELQWLEEGVRITTEFTSFNIPNPATAVSDGLGNAIVLYSDSSGTKLQKVSGAGELLWGDGVSLFPVGRQMIGDGMGGAIVAGVRREFGDTGAMYIVGAQRVNGNGQVLWGDDGVVISEKADNQTLHVEIAVDRGGNSLVVWRDRRTGQFEEYTQRLNPNGVLLWEPDGVALSKFDSQKSLLGSSFAPDPDGKNAFIWHDLRIEEGGLFGQRLDSTGLRLWSEDDVPISTRDHFQRSHVVISDNAGGAIVCWYETGVGSGFGIFAQQVSRNGNLGEVLVTSVSEPDESPTPVEFVLHQSYPNPFNAETLINYEIPETNFVKVSIYDIMGKEVIKLVEKTQVPGTYQVKWNGKNRKGGEVASGLYFYQLRAGSFVQVKKALLIR